MLLLKIDDAFKAFLIGNKPRWRYHKIMTSKNSDISPYSFELLDALTEEKLNFALIRQLVEQGHEYFAVFSDLQDLDPEESSYSFNSNDPETVEDYRRRAQLAFEMLDAGHRKIKPKEAPRMLCLLPYAPSKYAEQAQLFFKDYLEAGVIGLPDPKQDKVKAEAHDRLLLAFIEQIVRSGNLDFLNFVFKHLDPVYLDRARCYPPRNPITLAIEYGHTEMAQQLFVMEKNDQLAWPDRDRSFVTYPYLFSAVLARKPDVQLIQWLAEQGENIHACIQRDSHAQVGLITRLTLERRKDTDLEVVQTLLNLGVSPNDSEKGSINALSGIILLWSDADVNHMTTQMVDLLLAAGCDPNAPGLEGRTPFMDAARCNDVSTMEKMLRYGANEDAQDHQGNTALMYAVRTNRTKSIHFLWDLGVSRDVVNHKGETLLDVAHEDAKAFLIAQYNHQSLKEQTPLISARPSRSRI